MKRPFGLSMTPSSIPTREFEILLDFVIPSDLREKSMDTVYITGHRNPDMDSIAAAYAHGELKNLQTKEREYQAIRCGDAKAPTKALFKKLGLILPPLMKDAAPRVLDVIRKDPTFLEARIPILEAIRLMDEKNLSILPVLDKDKSFLGVVSQHEVSRFLISENLGSRPRYHFFTPNFEKVLPGRFFQRGGEESFSAPLMTGAMPYETSLERMDRLEGVKPVLVVGLRKDLLNFAVDAQLPALIITGMEKGSTPDMDFSRFRGTIYLSHTDTAETLRLLRLSAPVEQIMNRDPLTVEGDFDFDTAKQILLGSPHRGLPVMNDGIYAGMVTRRSFIEKPRKKLILVDHNELNQSVPGADQAQVVEILDHHRIDTPKTRDPIYVYARPVGSTCTIVFLHFQMAGVKPSPETAALLLGGLISDTLDLRSPTTTDEDRRVALALEEISPLSREETAQLIFSHSSSLKTGDPRDILLSDFKVYQERSWSVGIGQVEVITLEEVEMVKDTYFSVLEQVGIEKSLDWVMLLVTDVIKQDSVLFTSGWEEAEDKLIFKARSARLFSLPGILSRKKQLFPEVYRVLEEMDREGRG